VFGLTASAEAYVDPGAGSMFMQLVFGGIVTGVVFLRSKWSRVRQWFQRSPPPPPDKPQQYREW
jgi:hypothetical protein